MQSNTFPVNKSALIVAKIISICLLIVYGCHDSWGVLCNNANSGVHYVIRGKRTETTRQTL